MLGLDFTFVFLASNYVALPYKAIFIPSKSVTADKLCLTNKG